MAKNSDNQPTKTKRELFNEGFSSRYQDIDLNDEDAFYGKLSEDYEEYERIKGENEQYRKDVGGMLDVFNKDERTASFLSRIKKGENLMEVLFSEFGDDIRDAIDDPDKREAISKANEAYYKRITDERGLKSKSEQNIAQSLEALDKVIAEGGYTNEQADKAFDMFDKVQTDALVNKVDEETWRMFFKAATYDSSVEQAHREGQVEGRNEKIREKLERPQKTDGIPNLRGGGSVRKTGIDESRMGALSRFGPNRQSIWDKGKA